MQISVEIKDNSESGIKYSKWEGPKFILHLGPPALIKYHKKIIKIT